MKINITIVFLLLLTLQLSSQDTPVQELWSFDKCVSHALENNISIKQQALNVNYRENQLTQSKYSIAPNVNASTRYKFNFGKSTQFDNTFVNQNSQVIDFALNADVVLFNGFAKQNTIKKRQLELDYTTLNLQKIKDDITLSVASAYLQILFNKELVEATKEQIEVTKLQLEDNKKQVEVGNMPQGKLYETEAQLASEELTLTNYENQLVLSTLDLAQLLELETTNGFNVVIPEFDESLLGTTILTSELIFGQAVTERPEILSKELELKSFEYDTKIAKAQMYPVLSAFAGYNNFYNNKFMRDSVSKMPLSDQLDLNGQTTVGLQLNIPIYNGLTARTNLKNSKINYENSRYELQLEKNNLLKEIQQVHANAIASMKKYYSSKKAVESTREAFRYIEEKFNLGIVTSLEYNDAKTNLTNAQSSFIQAKYEYLFKVKILDFYNGTPIAL